MRRGIFSVRLGDFERITTLDKESASQAIEIVDCARLTCSWTETELPQPEIVSVYIRECETPKWADGSAKAGAFDLNFLMVNLALPAAAFSQFWKAAELTDGAVRNLRLELELPDPDDEPRSRVWTVTNVALHEVMATTGSEVDRQTWRTLPKSPRQHPVVVEMRAVRDRMAQHLEDFSRTAVVAVMVVGVSAVVGTLLIRLFQ